MSDLVTVSAIVTLAFNGNTLGELETWCDAIAEYGIDDTQQLLDGGHVQLVENYEIGPIMGTNRDATVADVRAFITRARANKASDSSALSPDTDLIAVDLPDPLIETFACGSHFGAEPRAVMASAHPLCRDHT